MIRALAERVPEQQVDRHLLADEGEHVVDLVRHHGIVYALPSVELIGVATLWLLALFGPISWGWVFLLASFSLLFLINILAWRRSRRLSGNAEER